MNAIRIAISVFLLILFGLSIAGWIWSPTLPTDKMWGARAVLAICGFAAIGGLALLWSVKQPRTN